MMHRVLLNVTYVVTVIALASCDRVENVSSDANVTTHLLEKPICTKRDLYLWHWKNSGADFFEFQEYDLHTNGAELIRTLCYNFVHEK